MTKRYGIFEENGLPKGFYSDDVHKQIPDAAIDITDEHWREFIENQGLRKWDGVKPVVYTPPDTRTYADKRQAEYPPIGDQLDAIMKWVAGENEITVTPELKSIAMQCMSVKARHPKPEGV